VWRVVGEILDGLEDMPDLSLASALATQAGPGSNGGVSATSPVPLVGLAVQDTSDTLVLRMLGQLHAPSDFSLEIITDTQSSLQVAERVAEQSPRLVLVSHFSREGLTLTRYLIRRLRARFADMPILVGRWRQRNDVASAEERLLAIGASRVVITLADPRDRIRDQVVPEQKRKAVALGSLA
jgi:methylmalonyl-CoA mutase cobalamin-binding subunit